MTSKLTTKKGPTPTTTASRTEKPQPLSTSINASTCPVCGRTGKGLVTCCGFGGSWQGKCGKPGDTNFEHSWNEGVQACSKITPPDPITPPEPSECFAAQGHHKHNVRTIRLLFIVMCFDSYLNACKIKTLIDIFMARYCGFSRYRINVSRMRAHGKGTSDVLRYRRFLARLMWQCRQHEI